MNKSKKKLFYNIIFIVLLFIMFTITTFALFWTVASVKDNVFETGGVKIDLNGGKKIFDDNDLCLQPNSSITKPLHLKNLGTTDIYYRIYLKNVNGNLMDIISLNIYQEGKLVKSIKPCNFTEKDALVSDKPLAKNETAEYVIEAVMPGGSGNYYRQTYISFDIVADGIQVKNNEDKAFN